MVPAPSHELTPPHSSPSHPSLPQSPKSQSPASPYARTQSPSPAHTSPQMASVLSADRNPASCPKSADTNRHPSSKSQSASRLSGNPSRISGTCPSRSHPDSELGKPRPAPAPRSSLSPDSRPLPPSKCAVQPPSPRQSLSQRAQRTLASVK